MRQSTLTKGRRLTEWIMRFDVTTQADFRGYMEEFCAVSDEDDYRRSLALEHEGMLPLVMCWYSVPTEVLSGSCKTWR